MNNQIGNTIRANQIGEEIMTVNFVSIGKQYVANYSLHVESRFICEIRRKIK